MYIKYTELNVHIFIYTDNNKHKRKLKTIKDQCPKKRYREIGNKRRYLVPSS